MEHVIARMPTLVLVRLATPKGARRIRDAAQVPPHTIMVLVLVLVLVLVQVLVLVLVLVLITIIIVIIIIVLKIIIGL